MGELFHLMLLIMSGSFKSNLAGSSSLRICLKDEIDNCREEVVVWRINFLKEGQPLSSDSGVFLTGPVMDFFKHDWYMALAF